MAFTGHIARYKVTVQDGTELAVDLPNPGPDDSFAEGTVVTVQLPKSRPYWARGNDVALSFGYLLRFRRYIGR